MLSERGGKNDRNFCLLNDLSSRDRFYVIITFRAPISMVIILINDYFGQKGDQF